MTILYKHNIQSTKKALSSTTYTLSLSDSIYLGYNGQTINLPDPSTCRGQKFTIKLPDSYSTGITIDAGASFLIDGVRTYIIKTSYGFVELISNSDSWSIVNSSYNFTPNFSTNTFTLNLTDNQATSLDIKEGSTSYLKFDTSNSAEKITMGKPLIVVGNVTIKDGSDNTKFSIDSSTGDTIVAGNLTVNGTTTTINSTTTTFDDIIMTLGGDSAPTSDDNKDRGIEFRWHNGSSAKLGFFGYDDSAEEFIFIPDATNTSSVFSGTVGNARFAGLTLLNSLDVTNGETYLGALDATGAVTFGSTLSVTGAITGITTTQTALDNSTKLASTAYVQNATRVNTTTKTTNYTLALADEGYMVIMNSASATTLTVPLNSSVTIPVGAQFIISRLGAGTVNIASSATIYSVSSNKNIANQYGAVTLIKTGTDTWYLFGDLSAS
jgi:hypothetical protein